MKEKALCEPKDTKEMIDLMKYVEQAQQKTLIKLKEDIKVISNCCSYCSCLHLVYPLRHCLNDFCIFS